MSKEVLDDIALDDPCWICDKPIGDGDEPGAGFMDNGVEIPLCSVACTEKLYATDEAESN